MKNAVWALICLGSAVGLAGESSDRRSTVAVATHFTDDIQDGIEAARPAGPSVAEKRAELKELETRTIDELDEPQLDSRLGQARHARLEKKASDELAAITKQLSTLANQHPNTAAGQRAKIALEALEESRRPVFGARYSNSEPEAEPFSFAPPPKKGSEMKIPNVLKY